MIEKIKNFLILHEWLLVFVLVVVFILIRIPGLDSPLHQDEYKWPMSVSPNNVTDAFIPHPPVGELIYKTAGYLFGFDIHFRLVTLFFGAINLVLLYILMKILYGRREAFVSSLIWIFSFFSVLASMMVDTDGQIMPFFFLVALIGYFKQKYSNNKKYWLILMSLGLIFGLLVKLSFVLVILSFVADFLWDKKGLIDKKIYLKYFFVFVILFVFLAIIVLISKYIFPFFDITASFKYWRHFFVFDRAWFQTVIQCIKAILYASPFLVVLPWMGDRKDLVKIKIFIFFLIFAFVFYVVLFDFSIGALDRYLQLIILPLTIFVTIVITQILFSGIKRMKEFLLLGGVVASLLILIQSIPHYVPSLHPKTEWISRIISLKWNFVYPFSGGSGPLGLYVSFLFIAIIWIIFISTLIFSYIRPNYKKYIIIFLIPIGFIYNGIFIEEYLFGFWNGSAPKLLVNAIEFIKERQDIKMVTVYNDNGGDEIQKINKYRKRLYTDPKFDITEKIKTINKYKEHYFVLNVPRVDPKSVYQKFFDSCEVIYNDVDKKISATIYDCSKAPDIKI